MHRLGYRLSLASIGLLLGVGLLAPTPAQAATPTTTTLRADAAFAGQQTPLRIQLRDENGGPLANQIVHVQHRVAGNWIEVAAPTTGGSGNASADVELSRQPDRNVYRAVFEPVDPNYEGSSSGPVQVELKRRKSSLTLDGPGRVKDEKSLRLRVGWLAKNGDPVAGKVRLLESSSKRGSWKVARKLRTGDDGRASVSVKPRADTWYRVMATGKAWVRGDRSPAHFVDNIPPGIPVKLPRGAPNPRIHLPVQPDAVGQGAHPVVTGIPDRIWSQMTGRTWHSGCPVGRGGLRLLRINYWDYDGYRRRGELVANADAVHQMAGALSEMYRRNLPIRAMYREDRFGWSDRLHGANDYRSMAAGNTSAFNCRGVVGNPGTRSPHSYGRSLDLNTWENPYRSAQGTVPNRWWMGHSHPRVAWRSRSHIVVRVMARHGLRWTYGTGDTQHFDARAGSGRMTTAELNAKFLECGGVCD